MNPLTNMKNVLKLSEQELHTSNKTSWHDQYRDSAWIFVAGFPFELTEGDLVCIFSQYGEIVHMNLVRHKDTGKSRGFCFICYEDQRSTVLAVDNLNGIKVLNKTVRVDHVSNYKVPKNVREEAEKLAPPAQTTQDSAVVVKREPAVPLDDVRETLADQITADIRLPPRLPIYQIKEEPKEPSEKVKVKKEKKSKKEKKEKKKKHKGKKKKKKRESNSDSSSGDDSDDGGDDEPSSKRKRR